MTGQANPYAGIDLFMPTRLHPTIRQLVGAGMPFPRQVDAWWLGLCIGVRYGEKRPRLSSADRTKFIEGTIFSSDPWRIVHLELLALAEEGEQVLLQPSTVISLASSYADYGLEWIVDQCVGTSEPTLALLNSLDVDELQVLS